MWISPTLAVLAPLTLALGLDAASNHVAYAQPTGVTAAASYSGSDREPQLRRGAGEDPGDGRRPRMAGRGPGEGL